MALTYRKNLGRPLTSDEIDANFAFFTSSLGGATTGSNTFVGNQIITGSILISGSIIPNVGVGELTSSFDLGSETAAWRDIYVSEGSIKFIKSGSAEIVLSAKDGGISVNGGSTISADGVSGQFITSKSLSETITVKDSNNSLLMGPIDVETDTEIIVEENSDLTIFGDIEITNVDTANAALFATSASYSNEAISSSFASSASFSDSSSYATTASYALNATAASTFPYSGSAVITGSLIVNDGTNDVIDTSQHILNDNSGVTTIDWQNKVLKQDGNRDTVDWDQAYLNDYSNESLSVDWESRLLVDTTSATSVDWENRTLKASDGNTAINYSDSASLLLSAGGSTLDINKYSTFTNDGVGTLTINGGSRLNLSGSTVALQSPLGYYTFISASSTITSSSPTQAGGNMTLAFAQNEANFFIYVYIGGQWRSASLS
jgi:hypothetical protein